MQQRLSALDLARRMQDNCLGTRIGRLHRIVGRHFDQALRPLGLSLSQMEILSALTLIGDPVKPSDVAEVLEVDRSTMSRNLALLERRNLVATTEYSASGRSLAVTVTTQGSSALADAQTAWTKAQDALMDVLGAAAPATLDRWLGRLQMHKGDGLSSSAYSART